MRPRHDNRRRGGVTLSTHNRRAIPMGSDDEAESKANQLKVARDRCADADLQTMSGFSNAMKYVMSHYTGSHSCRESKANQLKVARDRKAEAEEEGGAVAFSGLRRSDRLKVKRAQYEDKATLDSGLEECHTDNPTTARKRSRVLDETFQTRCHEPFLAKAWGKLRYIPPKVANKMVERVLDVYYDDIKEKGDGKSHTSRENLQTSEWRVYFDSSVRLFEMPPEFEKETLSITDSQRARAREIYAQAKGPKAKRQKVVHKLKETRGAYVLRTGPILHGERVSAIN